MRLLFFERTIMKKLLTIAGSDSSGGAGIQADLKTFAALGAYGMSCICALTAQNTTGVTRIENADPHMVTAQLDAVYADIPPDAVKTGMLSNAAIAGAAADFLHAHRGPPVVVDPVMVATSGAVLLEEAAIRIYKQRLLAEAAVVTPNIPEAEVLAGMAISDKAAMEEAARHILGYGGGAVLIKGGHRQADALDVLYDGRDFYEYPGEKIQTKNTHGTGCTLSSAIAVFLADGFPVPDAVGRAKAYLTGAIRRAQSDSVGQGHGPVHHFWMYGEKWGRME